MSSKQGCGAHECAIAPIARGLMSVSRCSCTEAEIQNAILLHFGAMPGVVLWRNNRGSSKSEVCSKEHMGRLLSLLTRASPGALDEARGLLRSLLSEEPRFTQFGLAPGASDIIGMVRSAGGSAVFVAIEVKRSRGGVLSREQSLFIELVNATGGSSGVARSLADAGQIISKALRSA